MIVSQHRPPDRPTALDKRLQAAKSPSENFESISEVVRIYPLKSEASSDSAIAMNKPQQMPRAAAIPSRARRDRSRIILSSKIGY
ncbi:hypothetical protein NE852_15735 [Rhizobium sp. Pop5]|uniref:hypothetical protein n=1 Tax=Rhizobium sp. Pop5 TaxID=1223565 RepID=UPI0002834C4C|nr:hypothetical protein [Rhizobium sp. Pop5]EJZ19666.1 hypothetical protein RCCGEPOP_19168 [Rhizobium sp. Pop5]UVD55538.1 hypothetical protein NE852_15735 [Rhizobium sp. Pop5]